MKKCREGFSFAAFCFWSDGLFTQPVFSSVCDEERDIRQGPADGIAQHQHSQGVEPAHHHKQPEHTDYTDTDTGDQSRHHRITGTPHGTCEDLHRYKNHVEGNHPQHQPGAQPDHFRVGGEDSQDEVPEENDHRAASADEDNAHSQTDLDTFVDPVIFLGTVILAHKGVITLGTLPRVFDLARDEPWRTAAWMLETIGRMKGLNSDLMARSHSFSVAP